MTALTDEQVEVLTGVYEEDVSDWEWRSWLNVVSALGVFKVGMARNVLPYKPSPYMSELRREVNSLYFNLMDQYAQRFRCRLLLDNDICEDRLLLYDPKRFDRESLKAFLAKGAEDGYDVRAARLNGRPDNNKG